MDKQHKNVTFLDQNREKQIYENILTGHCKGFGYRGDLSRRRRVGTWIVQYVF